MPLRFSGQPLIVVPHGIPKVVPFAALFDGERYLLDGAGVSLAPSAAVYATCRRFRHLEAGWLITSCAPHEYIPHTLEEVEQIGRIVQKTHIFLGDPRRPFACRRANWWRKPGT